jgi:hypothetical protein
MCDKSHLIKRARKAPDKSPVKRWVVRVEKEKDDVLLVWENSLGSRWYEKIVSQGVPVF